MYFDNVKYMAINSSIVIVFTVGFTDILQVPKPRPLTKWQEYMKTKGFQKRERSKLVWDEEAKVICLSNSVYGNNVLEIFCLTFDAFKEWKPRWGYRRGNDETKDWLLEVPENEGLTII